MASIVGGSAGCREVQDRCFETAALNAMLRNLAKANLLIIDEHGRSSRNIDGARLATATIDCIMH